MQSWMTRQVGRTLRRGASTRRRPAWLPRRRRDEAGFTLIELLISVGILAAIAGAVLTVFTVSLQNTSRVRGELPGPRAANGVGLFLTSDISSATPVDPKTWLNTDPGTDVGCAAGPKNTVNVLRIESRNPLDPSVTYVASYRYQAPSGSSPTGSLWRVFCVAGATPSTNTVVASDIDPSQPPVAVVSDAMDSAELRFGVRGRSSIYPVKIAAAVRTMPAVPAVVVGERPVVTQVPPCQFVKYSISAGQKESPKASPLVSPVSVVVVTNEGAGAVCTHMIAKIVAVAGATCDLSRKDSDTWAGSCFGGVTFPEGPTTVVYPVFFYDRVDEGNPKADPVDPPIDLDVAGIGDPSLTVTTPLPPGPPTNVTAKAGDRQLQISWTAPVLTEGMGPITGYTVSSSPGTVVCTTTGATTCTLTGLTNGTTYTITVRAINNAGAGTPSAPITAKPMRPLTIVGTVFEDVNYGGGAGRGLEVALAAGGSRRPDVRVELYSVAGATATQIATTATAKDGTYSFDKPDCTTCAVRVVVPTVTSGRAGATGTLAPVLTFETMQSGTSITARTDMVGGTNPAVVDAGSAATGAVFDTTSGVFASGATGTAQAFAVVSDTVSDAAGMDFGFNYDTVTNTNDSGAGSLRQVITNANAFTDDAGLSQGGRPAKIENVVFMLPNGTTGAGGSLSLSGGLRSTFTTLTSGVATIAPSTSLPSISAPLVVDARTQPGWTSSPVVQLDGSRAGTAYGLVLAADGSQISGLMIGRFGAAGILTKGTGSHTITGNWIGLDATGSAAAANGGGGIEVASSNSNTIGGLTAADRNVISGNTGDGINVNGGANKILGNWIGLDATGAKAVANTGNGVLLRGAGKNTIGGAGSAYRNVISGNATHGINVSGTDSITIQGNAIGTDAGGTRSIGNKGSGVLIEGSNGVLIGGTSTPTANVITASGSAGVSVTGGTSITTIEGNSITANGGLGIDLANNGVTLNDGAKTTGQPNSFTDTPVFLSSGISGSTLSVRGYVGSAASQATFAGDRVEVFVSDLDASGYGEGATYVGFVTADVNGNFNGTITVPSGVTITSGTTKITGTATNSSGTSEFGPNTTVGTGLLSIKGTVFEDVNYGGGAGRSLSSSSGATVNGARVELYDSNGVFVSATSTSPSGAYTFNSLGAGVYSVRVVDATVASTRTGSTAGLLPVLTYRTDLPTTAVLSVTDHVGGTLPSGTDAPSGNSATTLFTSCSPEHGTCAFTGAKIVRYGANGTFVTRLLTGGTACENTVFGDPLVGTFKACYVYNDTYQSLSTVTLDKVDVTGIDFGYNFDTVVNTNNSGAGSLRQVITNANALTGDATLVQSGRTAKIENAIFMLSNGTGTAGTRSFYSAFTSGIATVNITSGLPTVSAPMIIDAQTQAGWSSTPIVQVSATSTTDLFVVNGGSTVIRGLIINGASASAIITTSDGNTIQGNYIGLTAAGTAAAPNGIGVAVRGVGNVVGGTTTAARNVISGNTITGVQVAGASTSGTTIQGNYIGTNAAGTAAIANGAAGAASGGVWLTAGTGTTIGGTSASARNVLSGNGGAGVWIDSGTATIQGNYIGTNAAGDAAVPNGRWGISLYTSGNTIGGTASGAGNVISGHTAGATGGIYLNGDSNVVQGNIIGLNAAATAAIPNGDGTTTYASGIDVRSGGNNVIGGTGTGAANIISGNNGYGIRISSTTAPGTKISGNSIYGNTRIGIDLGADGVTANDGLKSSTAANQSMDMPVLGSATLSGSTLTFSGYVGSAASQTAFANASVEVFVSDNDASGYGQGKTYLGTISADASGNIATSMPVPTGVTITPGTTKLTATATDNLGNTSEFSANVTVSTTISGTVFEDVNYGGGAGRSLAASSGVVRPSARVELYSVSGTTATYLSSTTTDASGAYSFAAPCATCAVRVVESSVTSSRNPSKVVVAVGVPTYLTDASSGSVSARTDYVGGTVPSASDGGNGAASTTFDTGTGTFSAGTTGTAQAFAVVAGGSARSGIDFGFNFDTVVNTNDSGRGSLRQVINNANQLTGDATLAVSGRLAGYEHVVFMLPNGTTGSGGSLNLTGGLRSTLNTFTTAGGSASVATITPTSEMAKVTTPMVIDAQTQPGWTTRPIVELRGSSAGVVNGLSLNADNTTLRGLIVNRFAGEGVTSTTGNTITIQGNWIGLDATGTAGAGNGLSGVWMNSTGTGHVIGGASTTQRNVIAGNTAYEGVAILGGSGHVVAGNYIGTDSTGTTTIANGRFGIYLRSGVSASTVGGSGSGAGNLVVGSASAGIYLEGSTATVQGNTVRGNGAGGVVVVGTGSGNKITQNAISANTGYGIDLAWNGLSANDGLKTTGQPNLLMDAPVFTAANLSGSTLSLTGYVGSAAGQTTFANANVEVFVSDNDASGYGEGMTYLGTVAADPNGNIAGTVTVPASVTLTVGTSKITGTATDSLNNTSEFGANTTVTRSISGKVFEDVNYGGGAGRSAATSSGVGVAGARVELYSVSGTTATYVTFATTDANGAYSFATTCTSCAVRVVNSSVVSTRTGSTSSLLGVPTFVTDASSGTATAVTNKVGGTNPAATDGGNGAANTAFSTSTGVFSVGTTGTAEAYSLVNATSAGVSGVDFGFNFDTVASTKDSGAGSLRQVMTNMSALGGESTLAQAGRTAAVESTIFQLATTDSGYQSLTSHWKITLSSVLPVLTGSKNVIDGTTQSGAAVGNLWAGTPHTLKVELNGNAIVNDLLRIGGTDNGVVGMILGNTPLAGVRMQGTRTYLRSSYVGLGPDGSTTLTPLGGNATVDIDPAAVDPTVGGANSGDGNVIIGTGGDAVLSEGGSTGLTVTGNFIGTNALGTALKGSLTWGGVNNLNGTATWKEVRRNLIAGTPRAIAVDPDDTVNGATSGTWTIAGNYLGVARDGTTLLGNTRGVVIEGVTTGLTIGGSGSSDPNLIAGNTQRGIDLTSVSNVRIQQNSIWGNTGLGIDISANGVTANDGLRSVGSPNLLMDSPVITSAGLSGSTLTVSGYVGSAAGQAAFANARVELFVSDVNASGSGDGKTYLGAITSSSTSGTFSGTITVPSGVSITTGTTKVTATATDSATGATSEFGANVIVVRPITGTVFEDVNYGGGAGRDLSTALANGGVVRPGATVELYNLTGTSATYLGATTTDANGAYSFAPTCTTCVVRVVSSSVTTSRTGLTGFLGVPTYLTDASGSTVSARTDWVGGINPSATPAPAAVANSVFSTTTGVFSAGVAGTAQAFTVVSASAPSTGIDFGFNFDTVVNTNDSGAGSLRQVITNANTLGNDTLLAVSGRTAGYEHVIFMISNGTTGSGGSLSLTGGLRTTNNYFSTVAGSYNVATIAPTSALPTVTNPLFLDAQAQPGWTLNPIVELNGAGTATSNGLTLNASNVTVRGLVINRFGWDGIGSTSGSNITVQGNWIGINAAGTAKSGNGYGGVYFNSTGNNHLVGGTTAAQRNVLSGGSTYEGVGFEGGSGHVVSGNYIGLDPTGTIALGNSGAGVSFYSGVQNSTVGGTATGAGNVISGNGLAGVLFDLSNNNTVQGNRIGTNAAGTAALRNQAGISINGGTNHVIGGSVAGAGNLISGNGTALSASDAYSGIYATGSSNLTIAGNTIGLAADQTTALANVRDGIYLAGTSSATIGGLTSASRNWIAGNGSYGIALVNSGSTSITNNYVGLASDGSTARGNGADGIDCAGSGCTLTSNVIAANTGDGVSITGSASNTLKSNYIGTDATGLLARGNGTSGVFVSGSGVAATIGSANASERNVISANTGYGIRITSSASANAQGNYIGVGANGTTALGNNGPGVSISNTSSSTIGGTATGAGNTIANNTGVGVAVGPTSGSGNLISGNAIYANGSIGIDIGTAGVSANDGTKPFGSANLQMDSPVLTSATVSGSSVTVAGYVGSASGQATFGFARVEMFVSDGDASGYGEGKAYVGSLSAVANGTFSGSLSLPTGYSASNVIYLTATATDSSNNTSEFGRNYAVALPVTSGLVVSLDANKMSTMYQNSAGSTAVSASGQSVCRWSDTSGVNNHATQATTAMCPTYGTDATGGYVNFAANGYVSSTPTLSPDASVFVVAQSNTASWNTYGWVASARGANGFIIHPWSGATTIENFVVSSAGVYASASAPTIASITSPNLYEMTMSGSNPITGVSGANGSTVAYSVGAARAAGAVSVYFGADDPTLAAGRLGNGKIREVLIYNRAVSAAELAQIEAYLRAKWGTP